LQDTRPQNGIDRQQKVRWNGSNGRGPATTFVSTRPPNL